MATYLEIEWLFGCLVNIIGGISLLTGLAIVYMRHVNAQLAYNNEPDDREMWIRFLAFFVGNSTGRKKHGTPYGAFEKESWKIMRARFMEGLADVAFYAIITASMISVFLILSTVAMIFYVIPALWKVAYYFIEMTVVRA